MGAFADLTDEGFSAKQAALGVRLNADASPEKTAEALQLARRYSIPPAVAEQFAEDYRARAKTEDALETFKRAPKLGSWIAEQPERQKVAADDIDTLGGIESVIRTIKAVPSAVASAFPRAGAGLYGAAAAPFEVAGQGFRMAEDALAEMFGAPRGMGRNVGETVGGFLLNEQRAAQAVAQRIYTPPADAGVIERGVGSGFQSATQTLLTLPIAMREGGQNVALGILGLIEGGASYGRGREVLAPSQAAVFGIENAVAEVVTERLPFAKLLGDIKAGTSGAKMLVNNLVREVPGELAATLWQNFNEWANLNPEKSVVQWLGEQPEALAETVVATLVGGGAQVGAIKSVQYGMDRLSGKARQAEQDATQMEALAKLAEASKLRSRDAETFREYVEQVADERGDEPGEFYIDGQVLANSLNQSGVTMQELEAVAPVVARQLEAAATGGDIRIPVSEFMTAGEAITAPLIDHLRTAPEAMSRAEARDYLATETERMSADLERAMQDRVDRDEFRASVEAVRQEFQTELDGVKRFTSDVNRAYADLLANFYGATAARLGVKPQELLQKYRLRVQSRMAMGDRNLTQGDVLDLGDIESLMSAPDMAGVQDNASGESAASLEAQSRLADEKAKGRRRVVLDVTNGQVMPLVGVDAVDTAAGPGKIVLQRGIGANDWTVLSAGDGVTRNAAMAAVGRGRAAGALEQPVFHGSPHTFDAFSLEHIGKGEGAQAYGWGLYFAENRQIAKGYYERLSNRREIQDVKLGSLRFGPYNGFDYSRRASQSTLENIRATFAENLLIDEQGMVEAQEAGRFQAWVLEKFDEHVKDYQDDWPEAVRPAADLRRMLAAPGAVTLKLGEQEGGIYSVEIPDAAIGKMLLWDEPINEQPKSVQDAIRKALKDWGYLRQNDDGPRVFARALKALMMEHGSVTNKDSGEAFYKAAEANAGSDKAASEYLDSIGIPGLRYWDGGSRAAGNGTRNVVVWNQATLDQMNAQVQRTLEQRKDDEARAQISLPTDITASPSVISLLEGADLSSFIHESGHFFLEVQADLAIKIQQQIDSGASVSEGERSIVADMNRLLEWFGVQGAQPAGGETGGALDQPAYHGTPHRGIDKFSTDKIGTGEGAQAYGWGLYFAGKREVAEHYRKTLAGATFDYADEATQKRMARLTNFDDWIWRYLSDTAEDANYEPAKMVETLNRYADRYSGSRDQMREIAKLIEDGKLVPKRGGALYEVNVTEDDELLLWDKPLNEQPRPVREALADFADRAKLISPYKDVKDGTRYRAILPGETRYFMTEQEARDAVLGRWDGGSAYMRLAERGGQRAASEALSAIGIKGIKYLDGTSRGAGDGTYNYVIFSGDDVAIRQTFYQGQPEGDTPAPAPLGRTPLETWAMMSLDEKRAYHEQFARGFEAFAFEGKAPSIELQGIFQRFRSWLMQVYKTLRNLNVELTDDVRAVMGRMIATDYAIEEAEAQRAMGPLFKSADDAGMTLEEFNKYQALAGKATEAAVDQLQTRSLADMKWMGRARDRALKERQKEVEALRREILHEVRSEVMREPVYQAWQYLTGKSEDATEAGKLRTEELREMYGIDEQAIWRKLSARRMTSDATGRSPESVAEDFGFDSGDALVKALADAVPPSEVIEARADQRMLEMFGDITSPEALARAADEAVHNEARARFIAAELKALQDANTVRAETGRTRQGRRLTTDVLASAAKDYAAQIIGRQRVRDLRPGQYAAAEVRSAKLAEKAFAAGKLEEAAMHKRNQLVNHYAAKAAYDAQAEVKKQTDYFRKFEKRPASVDPGYLDQIEAMLERFDFRPVSLREVDRRKSLKAWYDEQVEMGTVPAISDELLDEAHRKSYKDMTLEELRGLRDAVRNIEHLGRLKNKLLLARDKRTFDAIAEQIAQTVRDNGGKPREVALEGEKGIKPFFDGLAAMHRKLSSYFRQMDGGRDDGPLYEYIGRAMNERGAWEDTQIEQATVRLQALYKPLTKMRGGITGARSKLFIPEINASLTRGGRLAVAMNWGNADNRQRIMDGDKWSEAQVRAILKTLTKEELDFVNGVWEFIDSYWPEVAAKEKRITGVEPEKVKAEPFTVMSADGVEVSMRGGYYPLKYDTDRSDRADTQEAAQVAKEMMRGAMTRATTRRGHTKERLQEVKRAVRKDLNVITQHVTQVVHDLAWHEWLIDTNRLLRDDRVVDAIREHYGPKVLETIRDNISGIATADVVPQTEVDKALMVLRANVSRATMGASLTTAFLQPFGLTQSMVRIGAKHVLRGGARWAGDAARMENTLEWIRGKSEFMRLRSKSFNRELREINQTVANRSAAMRAVDGGLFWLMQKMQLVADVPTWIGQYEKTLAEYGPVDETDAAAVAAREAAAVAQADRAVIEAQGSGQVKDLAEVQRKHPMLTQFYSYFSVTLNLVAEKTGTTDFKNPRAVAGWLGDMALLLVIPAILPALLLDMARGGGEDDEPEDLAKKIAKWQLAYLMGLGVGIREGSGMLEGFDYAGPPVGRVVSDIGKAGKQTAQGELDEPAVLAYARLIGTAFGLPVIQVIRSYKGWKAWDEGEEGAGPQSVLVGPPPKQ